MAFKPLLLMGPAPSGHIWHSSKSRQADQVSLPNQHYIHDFWKDDSFTFDNHYSETHKCQSGKENYNCCAQGDGLTEAHGAKACVCDGCCHTEADKLARCEGGDLPGLSGHV